MNSQLIHAIFQFKKLISSGLGMDMAAGSCGINLSELLLMEGIADNSAADPCNNVSLAEIGCYLAVSKGAVSQMLGSLEKKGYINRDIDKDNRRNLIVTLTPEGREVLSCQYDQFAGRLARIIERLGENDVKRMIKMVNRMIEINNDINNELNRSE